MRELVPFRLAPIFRADFNPEVSCFDCGRAIKLRQAKIVMTDISEKKKDETPKEISLDEWARNTVSTILCEECWRRQCHIIPKTELAQ